MRISTAILTTTCLVTLASCSGSNNPGPSPTPDGASGITYWMAPRTSEIDLQLVTTRPTQGF
jgi:hypothetical protein